MAQVEAQYLRYDTGPHIVSNQSRYLFDKKSLPGKLTSNRDTLRCWLTTVSKAEKHQLATVSHQSIAECFRRGLSD